MSPFDLHAVSCKVGFGPAHEPGTYGLLTGAVMTLSFYIGCGYAMIHLPEASVVNWLTGLFTLSLLPVACMESTV